MKWKYSVLELNQAPLNSLKVQNRCTLNPTVFNYLKHWHLSNAMNTSFHKRRLFRNLKKTKIEMHTEEKKESFFQDF